MNSINGFTFYRSYYECLDGIKQQDREEILYAILEFVFNDKEPEFDGFKKTIWTLIKPNLITSKNKSNNAQKKEEQNQIEIKLKSNENQTEIKQKHSPLDKDKDKEEDIDIDIYKDNNKKNINKKYGIYKRILLTDDEYSKLCLDFAKDIIDNQITLLDEYIQSNNNKNKYTDFNLVLRKSLKDNWFTKASEFKKKETFDEILDRSCKKVEERNKL